MPTMKYLFFDCDDCLYQNGWKTADKITAKIAAYCSDELGVDKRRAYELYKAHGTCLKGLLRDDALRDIVEHCGEQRHRYVFTASVAEHAERCLKKIGIPLDAFYNVVDTRTCRLETKHSWQAFDCAMVAAGTADHAECVLFDDSVKNIRMAKELGWTTVLVGLTARDTGDRIACAEADYHVASLHDIPAVLPGLFPPGYKPPPRPVKPTPYPRLAG
ncbi:nucleotidase [Aureococcus anophagefferens]|nr:nucleotidase [Aureococcus anophagefferens]